MTQLAIDFTASAKARDAGCDRVLEHADDTTKSGWSDYVVMGIRLFSRNHSSFTAEDFRAWWDRQGGEQPPHVNAWGAVFRKAAGAGVIRATGRFVKSSNVAAHARMVQVWEPA